MSDVKTITSVLTGEEVKVFDFCRDDQRADSFEPSPVAIADSYEGLADKGVSLQFTSLLNGIKET